MRSYEGRCGFCERDILDVQVGEIDDAVLPGFGTLTRFYWHSCARDSHVTQAGVDIVLTLNFIVCLGQSYFMGQERTLFNIM